MTSHRRVAVVVLARAGSSRLPGKVLLPFGGGTVLSSVIERCAALRRADELVLATTRAPADDVLAAQAARLGVRVVRGSEQDVVARMLQAVDALERVPDVVVRACADNPLVMPGVVDQALDELHETGADLITPFECPTWPFGFGLVAMTRACLERIDREARAPAYREHVENYCLERPGEFHLRCQVAPEALAWPELCATLDHPVDLERLRWLRAMVEGIPLHEQPAALVGRLRAARVWVEGLDPGEPEGHDLVLLAEPRPGLGAPRGVALVDTFEVGGERRHGLRYADGRAPLFLDQHDNTAREGAAAFLERAAPLALPLLLAPPARPIDLQEAAAPPPDKRVLAEGRRGFAGPHEEAFPLRVVLEHAADDSILERLLPELARHPLAELVLGERATDPFRELAVDEDGRLALAGACGDLSSISLEAFWRSPGARAARAAALNAEAAP